MKIDGRQKKWFWFLAILLTGYTLKSIFIGADMDESYGVTVGWRLVQGDRLLWEMWEPHQTSAIFTALFIRLILLLTGGSVNYLTVLLRVCFFAVQGGIAWFVYKTFRDCFPWVEWEFAALMAMIYYITSPKCNYVPEYSNLHVWFSTLMALFLLKYYCEASAVRGKWQYLALAGCALTCDVLAYPSMALFFPFCFVYILHRPLQKRLAAAAAFVGPCIAGAAAFLGYLLSYMTVGDILKVIPYITGEGSHQIGILEKIGSWEDSLLELAALIAICMAAGAALLFLYRIFRPSKADEKERDTLVGFLFFWFLAQLVMQSYFWATSIYNAGYPETPYVAVPLFGAFCYLKTRKRHRCGCFLIALAVVNYIALMLFSNWEPIHLSVYLTVGLWGGFLCWRQYFTEKLGSRGSYILRVICMIFLISNIIGRSILMIGPSGGRGFITEIRGYCWKGVRAGILTSYMNAYCYNMNLDTFDEIVPKGSKIFYLGTAQYYYMLGDCKIVSPNTISTPAFDESLNVYYELHPELIPDMVIVESSYGEIHGFAEDSYIMRWIEDVYDPSEVTDYPYIRVYRK